MLSQHTPGPAFYTGPPASVPSSVTSSVAAARSTVKVRNVRESVVYHLIFDGDIGKLTGQQLRAHIETVSGIPATQQLLSFNGQGVTSTSIGATLGLRDGCTLLLDTMQRAEDALSYGAPAATAYESSTVAGATPALRAPSEHHHGSSPTRGSTGARPLYPGVHHSQIPISVSPARHSHYSGTLSQAPPLQQAGPGVYPYAPSAERLTMLDAQIDEIRRQEHEIRRQQSVLRSSTGRIGSDGPSMVAAPSSHNAPMVSVPRGNYAMPPTGYMHTPRGAALVTSQLPDVDVDVEVIEDVQRAPWQPHNSVDVDESRSMHQDYIWKMEQVRFETERMAREREMKRQQQELEYEAAVLDRERSELERRTQLERLKFDALRRVTQDQMAIQTRMTPVMPHY